MCCCCLGARAAAWLGAVVPCRPAAPPRGRKQDDLVIDATNVRLSLLGGGGRARRGGAAGAWQSAGGIASKKARRSQGEQTNNG